VKLDHWGGGKLDQMSVWEMGKEWARDHSDELAKEFFEHNYEEAVNQFTSERLQSL
jgi:hypothetical protein